MVDFLKQGFVLLHPTETCYGLTCRVHDEMALKRLYAMKQMALEKPISLLVKDLEMAKQYGIFSDEALVLAGRYWPGPLTLIVSRSERVPDWINPGTATIGMRVSSHPSVQALFDALNEPITTTSANVHGLPETYSVADALAQGLTPDAVIDEGSLFKNPPSTLIDLSGDHPKILRQGALRVDL